MADNIDAPLGQKKRSPRTRRALAGKLSTLPYGRILAGLSVLIVGAFALRIALVDDPLGGRPSATVDISNSQFSNPVATEVAEPAPEEDAGPASPGAASQDGPAITVLGDNMPSEADLPDPVGIRSLTDFGVIPDLVEETQNGPIPRIASDGTRPFEAYARAAITPASAGGAPLVAIVVTGLGINEAGTIEAVERLPDNVTLAFAPYAQALQRTTAAARAEGHELLLEVPLEPFDYPDNDPGPQTLLTGQPPRANLDRLFWLMSRMGGYIGLINNMGARFTASAADFSPLMEELGTRGLGYVDDGSSNRSLAPQLASDNGVPFARGTLQLDMVPSRAAMLEALDELETRAADRGSAIGIVSALPLSINIISEWAASLEEGPIRLVPVSALMQD